MFGSSFYDLQGKSVKEFLLPWSQDSDDLERFFALGQDDQSTFLFPPGTVDGEKHPVQMRFGAELKWEGHPATVLMFYDWEDSPVHEPKTV